MTKPTDPTPQPPAELSADAGVPFAGARRCGSTYTYFQIRAMARAHLPADIAAQIPNPLQPIHPSALYMTTDEFLGRIAIAGRASLLMRHGTSADRNLLLDTLGTLALGLFDGNAEALAEIEATIAAHAEHTEPSAPPQGLTEQRKRRIDRGEHLKRAMRSAVNVKNRAAMLDDMESDGKTGPAPLAIERGRLAREISVELVRDLARGLKATTGPGASTAPGAFDLHASVSDRRRAYEAILRAIDGATRATVTAIIERLAADFDPNGNMLTIYGEPLPSMDYGGLKPLYGDDGLLVPPTPKPPATASAPTPTAAGGVVSWAYRKFKEGNLGRRRGDPAVESYSESWACGSFILSATVDQVSGVVAVEAPTLEHNPTCFPYGPRAPKSQQQKAAMARIEALHHGWDALEAAGAPTRPAADTTT